MVEKVFEEIINFPENIIRKNLFSTVILNEVPPNSTVVGIPGKVKIQDGVRIKKDLNHSGLPGPIAEDLRNWKVKLQH